MKATKLIKPTASIYKAGSHLTFVLGNKSYNIGKNDSFFDRAVEAFKKNDWETVVSFVNRPQYIARYSEGRIQVTDDAVLFEGAELHGYVIDKILSFMEAGLPIGPIVRFLDNLQNARNEFVKNDLYLFLEKNDLPLTEDGGFLAYKLVQTSGKPYYQTSSDMVYKVGEVVEMPYDQCATSRDECGGAGLYAGNKGYWSESAFDKSGDYLGDGRMLLVKIMPSDVVSVPHIEDGKKLRACKMEVLSEYSRAARKQEAHVKEVESKVFTLEGDAADWDEHDDVIESDRAAGRPPYNTPKRDRFGRFIRPNQRLAFPSFKRDGTGRFAKASKGAAAVQKYRPVMNKLKRDAHGRFLQPGNKPWSHKPKRGAGGRFI